jgi:Ca2+/Na+ antiporter
MLVFLQILSRVLGLNNEMDVEKKRIEDEIENIRREKRGNIEGLTQRINYFESVSNHAKFSGVAYFVLSVFALWVAWGPHLIPFVIIPIVIFIISILCFRYSSTQETNYQILKNKLADINKLSNEIKPNIVKTSDKEIPGIKSRRVKMADEYAAGVFCLVVGGIFLVLAGGNAIMYGISALFIIFGIVCIVK